jgi:transposase-like protein
VKRMMRPMQGFKFFDAAQHTLAGIDLVHTPRRGQIEKGVEQGPGPA